jgi:hypothetical protein
MIRKGIDVGQSPQRSLASFICYHHGIYTNIVIAADVELLP